MSYIELNKYTERESRPLPNTEEFLERLAGCKWYFTMDGFSGYYSVELRKKDVHKTMFRTPWGTFAYIVMPLGLKNAPHTFSRLVSKVFKNQLDKSIKAYIDNVAVYSNGFEKHLEHIQSALEAIRFSKLKLKPSK